MVLLEVLVALLIVSIMGVAVVGLLSTTVRAADRMSRDEDRMLSAHRVLLQYTLMSERELAQRIGTRQVGDARIEVTRPRPAVYRIAVADTTAGFPELLVTLLYRPAARS